MTLLQPAGNDRLGDRAVGRDHRGFSDYPWVTADLRWRTAGAEIATAMVHGPAAGLERLDVLAGDPRLAGHHRLDAERTTSIPERNYLLTRAARLHAGT